MAQSEQEVKLFSDSDRKGNQSVSIDFDKDENDYWVFIQHDGDALSMSLKNWNKLIELSKEVELQLKKS
jgi:hypothetical protein